jgi:acetolactate synthase I/II/III large subunit
MNGAESLLKTAAAAGIGICFANPGTTELPLVSALDQTGKIRPVLCLAEGVCAGAADGYARMSGRPALTLLHLGPGLANGLAYFHNARRAATPIVNVVGDHASWHLAADAPLTSDIEALARTMSVWVKTSTSPDGLASDMSQAVYQSARGLATIIAPADYQSQRATRSQPPLPPMRMNRCSADIVEGIARALSAAGEKAALLLGGQALSARGLSAAGKIRAATGCGLIHETFPARIERGADQPAVDRLLYVPAAARGMLREFTLLVLAGAREPVTFFGYEGQPSSLVPPQTRLATLAPSPQDECFDAEEALEMLAGEFAGGSAGPQQAHAVAAGCPSGPLTPETFAAAVAAVQPEGAVIVDESVTSGFGYNQASAASPPHTYLVPHLGGAIGHGFPLATGAAVAAPGRPVILLEADGSGMYTLQSLWTQARESLNVTSVICANRKYRILQFELGNDTPSRPSSAADTLLNIDRPDLDWTKIAAGLGVPAESVTTAERLSEALARAVSEPGPHLIEAIL